MFRVTTVVTNAIYVTMGEALLATVTTDRWDTGVISENGFSHNASCVFMKKLDAHIQKMFKVVYVWKHHILARDRLAVLRSMQHNQDYLPHNHDLPLAFGVFEGTCRC